MNIVQEIWLALGNVGSGHPAGLLALALGGLALLHTALGLGLARLWYMFPVLFGLVALVGFLLNPFADATSPHDLRAKLINPETLTLLCIGQFLLTALALVQGLRLATEDHRENPATWLAAVHVFPAPLLIIALLVLEQTILVQTPGSRPEAVGRQVGLAIAGLLTTASLLMMVLPRRWLTMLHSLLAVAMLLACMFLPSLQASLPQPLDLVDWASLDLCWQVGLGFALPIGLGWSWGSWAARQQRARLTRSPLA